VGVLLRPGCGGLEAPSFSATSIEHAASQAERNRAQQHGDVHSCFYGAAMTARAQQHGGVRFCRAPRPPEQNSTAACASRERAPRQPEGTTARRRAWRHFSS
jgi:hypothetical protein